MIVTQETSKLRHLPRGQYSHPASRRNLTGISPINTIRTWGGRYFIFEVKQLLEVERQSRGYYPPMPDVIDLIRREFGAEFVTDAIIRNLPLYLRLYGCCYSEAGAEAFAAHPVAARPVLDIHAAYALPFGSVGNYLMWKLPRLEVYDSFAVDGVSIRRVGQAGFVVAYRDQDSGSVMQRGVSGDSLAEAIACLLLLLRGAALEAKQRKTKRKLPALPSMQCKSDRTRNRLMSLFYKRGYSSAAIGAALSVSPDLVQPALLKDLPDDLPEPVAPARKSQPAAVVESIRSDLPPLYYRNREDMLVIARTYQAKGYSMAQIQAALVRIDLAGKGQDSVQ